MSNVSVSEEFVAAAKKLADYLEHDERKDFESRVEKPDNHIYRAVVVIRECLNKEAAA